MTREQKRATSRRDFRHRWKLVSKRATSRASANIRTKYRDLLATDRRIANCAVRSIYSLRERKTFWETDFWYFDFAAFGFPNSVAHRVNFRACAPISRYQLFDCPKKSGSMPVLSLSHAPYLQYERPRLPRSVTFPLETFVIGRLIYIFIIRTRVLRPDTLFDLLSTKKQPSWREQWWSHRLLLPGVILTVDNINSILISLN